MDPNQDLPSKETVCALLDEIAPGSTLLTIESLPGSYSNSTCVVTARSSEDAVFRLVIRRYAVFGSYDRGEKARREFKTFKLLREHDIPAPEPVYLDDEGAILGTPGIITSYIEGKLIESPSEPIRWARSLATMLAQIHSVPCDATAQSFLLDANSEVAWVARYDVAPDYMQAHPDGVLVWQTVRDLLPHIKPVPPTLVHIDYWPGNVLWHENRISAVIDWEEAAYGDPGIDVAYCRMELYLNGLDQAADEFIRTYEAETGKLVANLGFWELAATARPMFHGKWATEAGPRLHQFIADARGRAG